MGKEGRFPWQPNPSQISLLGALFWGYSHGLAHTAGGNPTIFSNLTFLTLHFWGLSHLGQTQRKVLREQKTPLFRETKGHTQRDLHFKPRKGLGLIPPKSGVIPFLKTQGRWVKQHRGVKGSRQFYFDICDFTQTPLHKERGPQEFVNLRAGHFKWGILGKDNAQQPMFWQAHLSRGIGTPLGCTLYGGHTGILLQPGFSKGFTPLTDTTGEKRLRSVCPQLGGFGQFGQET